MQTNPKKTDVLIVGAGMAGLCAAIDLQNAGHDVLVIDKGRGLGGRMASRRIKTSIGEATFDHGAQFMTARDERFLALVNTWVEADVAKVWYRTSGGEVTTDTTGHPRWCGTPSITAIAKHLAEPLNIQNKARLAFLKNDQNASSDIWIATLENGETIESNAVILTPPVPQVLDLLVASKVELSEQLTTQLKAISYERCLAVMAVLDGNPNIDEPGSVSVNTGLTNTSPVNRNPIALIVDNQQKGISKVPAITIHATPEFSLENWEKEDRQACGDVLLEAAQPWLKTVLGTAQVIEQQTHGWLYSKPYKLEEESHLVLQASPPLLIAGDAFGNSPAGARVEGAALSGWAAANALDKLL